MNATTILWWMAQNTLSIAVLAGIVCLVSTWWKHRPALQHALWVVVLLKFLMPPVVAWPWSVQQMAEFAGWSRGVPARTASVESIEHASETAAVDQLSALRDAASDPLPVVAAPGFTAVHAAADAEAPGADVSWRHFAAPAVLALWLAGTLLVLNLQLRRLWMFQRLLGSCQPAPKPIDKQVRRVARRLRARPLPTRIAQHASTPFVWCWGWLRLIWPARLTGDGDLRRWRGIIAHELAHVQRRDHWVAWLEMLAGCLWWWNPLFWFVRRRIRDTADLACDARALSILPESERRAYAETFLELSGLVRTQTPAPALGVSSGGCRSMKRRLSMILNERVKGSSSLAGLLIAGMLAVVALPVWSLGQDTDSPKKPKAPKKPKSATTRADDDASVLAKVRDVDGDVAVDLVLEAAAKNKNDQNDQSDPKQLEREIAQLKRAAAILAKRADELAAQRGAEQSALAEAMAAEAMAAEARAAEAQKRLLEKDLLETAESNLLRAQTELRKAITKENFDLHDIDFVEDLEQLTAERDRLLAELKMLDVKLTMAKYRLSELAAIEFHSPKAKADAALQKQQAEAALQKQQAEAALNKQQADAALKKAQAEAALQKAQADAALQKARAEAAAKDYAARAEAARDSAAPGLNLPSVLAVDLSVSNARLDLLRRNYERAQQLQDKGFLSDADLERARVELELAQRTMDELQAQGQAALAEAAAELDRMRMLLKRGYVTELQAQAAQRNYELLQSLLPKREAGEKQ
jgi:beta-lactamase regulating signal transducer with metallopeptidase domain